MPMVRRALGPGGVPLWMERLLRAKIGQARGTGREEEAAGLGLAKGKFGSKKMSPAAISAINNGANAKNCHALPSTEECIKIDTKRLL